MWYKEAVDKATIKLVAWEKADRYTFCKFSKSIGKNELLRLDINYSIDHIITEGFMILVHMSQSAISVNNLEEKFEDPLNITPEEVELFKMEYGFDYPEELIDDL